MSLVRFACICDWCKARSDEYTLWPYCRECYLDTCPGCAREGTLKEHETDQGPIQTVVCEDCARHDEE